MKNVSLNTFLQFIQSRWMPHALCALLLLLSTVPMLWQGIATPQIISFAGYLFVISFASSCVLAVSLIVYELLHLQNREAILRILYFFAVWVFAASLTLLLTYRAKVPMDKELIEKAPELDIKVYDANEQLYGESGLVIPIQLGDEVFTHLLDSPNLILLEENHPDIIEHYLQQSPRWRTYASDTFYAQLGHVELTIKDKDGNPRGLVHAAFRAITEGEEMPHGYTPVKPGDKLPRFEDADEEQNIPDLAIDLGGDYFLLIAWRGIKDRTLALQSINESIRYIDSSFDILAKNPSMEQVQQLLHNKQSFTLQEADLLLSEPPSQYGTYQAEILANPQEAGQLILLIKEAKSQQVLRVISCYAQYSENEQEYFLHEIPADLPNWLGRQAWASGKLVLEPGIPLFTIKRGDSGQTFEVDFELLFAPADITKEHRNILKKRYRVHPCDYIAETQLHADVESDIKISQHNNLKPSPSPSPSPKTEADPEPSHENP
ncbi:MAG: hypothetical protein R3Y56_03230 [Akkermansia sp.]